MTLTPEQETQLQKVVISTIQSMQRPGGLLNPTGNRAQTPTTPCTLRDCQGVNAALISLIGAVRAARVYNETDMLDWTVNEVQFMAETFRLGTESCQQMASALGSKIQDGQQAKPTAADVTEAIQGHVSEVIQRLMKPGGLLNPTGSRQP